MTVHNACHERRAAEVRGQACVPSGRCSRTGFLGVCCAGLCVFVVPLVALLAPAAMLTHDSWIMGMLSGLSFVLVGTGLVLGRSRHHRIGPLLLGLAAAGIAALEAGHLLHHVAVLAPILLVTAWAWDHQLLKRNQAHGAS